MDNKIKATILLILEEMKVPVHRTKLVKLIYLADNLYYEHFGETITGLDYMWDNHGPNAMSNAIVSEADKLIQKDLVCMKTGTSMYGSENYLYSPGPQKPRNTPQHLLSPLEIQVISDTIKRYGGLNISSIVAVSKETNPFKNAIQYHSLHMEISPGYRELTTSLINNSEVKASLMEALKPNAESQGMKLEAVKQKYGL